MWNGDSFGVLKAMSSRKGSRRPQRASDVLETELEGLLESIEISTGQQLKKAVLQAMEVLVQVTAGRSVVSSEP